MGSRNLARAIDRDRLLVASNAQREATMHDADCHDRLRDSLRQLAFAAGFLGCASPFTGVAGSGDPEHSMRATR
jgi:hypothetical protein